MNPGVEGPGVDDELLGDLGRLFGPSNGLNEFGAADLVVLPIVVGVVYPIARAIEGQLPDWLTRVLLDSAKPPTYSNEYRIEN